jgi:aspartate kinase
VLQARSVQLAVEHGIDVHVRSSFTSEPGTWVRRDLRSAADRPRAVAHLVCDPLYRVSGIAPAAVATGLQRHDIALGAVVRNDDGVRFTAPGTPAERVVDALTPLGARVAVQAATGSVTLVGRPGPGTVAMARAALEDDGITVWLATRGPNRATFHLPAADVGQAVCTLHERFALYLESVDTRVPTEVGSHG